MYIYLYDTEVNQSTNTGRLLTRRVGVPYMACVFEVSVRTARPPVTAEEKGTGPRTRYEQGYVEL